VVRKLEACAAERIEWTSKRDLQFDTAKMEAALFTCRRGHKKHLWAKLRAKIKVGDGFCKAVYPYMAAYESIWEDTVAHMDVVI